MALYRRKRIKDRRHGAPPPGFPRENPYVPHADYQGPGHSPETEVDVTHEPAASPPDDVTKKTQ